MKKVLIIICCVLLLVSMPVFSQEEAIAVAPEVPGKLVPAYEKYPSALGLYASSLAGTGQVGGGLQYAHSWGPLGFFIAGGGVYDPSNTYYTVLDYNVIASLQYRVYGNVFSRYFSGQLYAWLLAGHLGYIRSNSSPYVALGTAGIGIGIEFILLEHLSIPIEFGFCGQFPTDPKVQFSFGGGLRYRY